MLNPHPAVASLDIGGATPCIVIDDALSDPQALVDLAALHREAFDAPTRNAYPGIELPLPGTLVERFSEHFAVHARRRLGARRVLDAHGRLSMVTLQPQELSPLQRVCHRDRMFTSADQCAIAAVLYLFHDEALGGTSFFSPKQGLPETEALMDGWNRMDAPRFEQETGLAPGYMTASNPHFSLLRTVAPRWNRLIYYDGGQFHNSHIEHPALLSGEPGRGRLTVNLFFRCSRVAA